MRTSRLLAALLVSVPALTSLAIPAEAAGRRPSTYLVTSQPGAMPEGIAVTSDGTMYVTSSATGAVYRGTDRDPQLHPFLPAGSDGRTAAAGIHVDRYGRIFVAGWTTGTLFVYSSTGQLLASRHAPLAGAGLNDLAFTRDAVYITDSLTGTLWRAALTGTTVGPLTAWLPPSAFPTAPQFLNGIVTSGNRGVVALVADQGSDQLFRVDLAARTATVVAVSGGSMGADGLLVEGDRLYGTVNYPDPSGSGDTWFVVRLAVLNPELTAATVVSRSQPETQAQTPTTLARDHGRLLWVNSQLAAAEQAPPYTVTAVVGLR